MKCESCGKKEATVRYYENINGSKHELHLCSECANKLGFGGFSNLFSPLFTSLNGLDLDTHTDVCENCGYSFNDYIETGYFGCPKCYESFENRLDDLFMKLHGKHRHVLDTQVKNEEDIKNAEKEAEENTKENVESLKLKLQSLVKEERYEEAAVVRDKIKEIEGK